MTATLAASEQREFADLRVTAQSLRRVRVGAAVFLLVQFGLYVPGARVEEMPFARWPVATVFIGLIALTNVASLVLHRSDDLRRLRRLAIAEVAIDAALAVGLTLLFSFDEDVRLWPLLAFPVLEGALRLELRGALAVWAFGSLSYGIDQGLRLPTREEPASWVAAIPWAAGVLLMIAMVSGLLASRLEQARLAAEQRAGDLAELSEELRGARDVAQGASLAKNEFLSRMSHELRTPMNAVLGFAQLLEMEELTEDGQESTDQILRAGNHLLGLIDDVLEISRIESGSMAISVEPVALQEVVSEVVDLLRPAAARRSVEVRLAPGDWGAVLADKQRLKQVLLNVLGNAVKYNRVGGSVDVMAVAADGGQLRLEVADTGRGIAPELLGRVFTPFDRLGVEASGIEGTGLGLALSQRIVEVMGGTMGVRSAAGVGSTFWVDLRASAAEPVRARSPRPVLSDEVAGSAEGRVLYIEDNLSNLRLVERLLGRLPDVELLSAMQGTLGVQLAFDHRPDLVLLDLNLPDINGDEVLAQLQADDRTMAIPVVVISADATQHQVERLLAAGARAYLTKPIDVPEFMQMVAEWLPAKGHAASLTDVEHR